MIFEIKGIGFKNKGAELMLIAVLETVRQWDVRNIVCIDRKICSPGQARKYGLHYLLSAVERKDLSFINKIVTFLAKIVPRRLFALLGITAPDHVEVVFDASGFKYSDQWGVQVTGDTVVEMERLRDTGKKIIFLPQAFGPFDLPGHAESMKKLLDTATLIFPRDEISCNHLLQVADTDRNISVCPDFTNLVRGRIPPAFQRGADPVCLIPNFRMIDKADIGRESYISFFAEIAALARSHGKEPFLLVHENTDDDRELAADIRRLTGTELKIVVEENPLFIKGIIGQCYLVAGSRFHGLASGLSQGIPCIGTSWSHKYRLLFEDYGCPHLLHDFRSGSSRSTYESLFTEEEHQRTRQVILKNAEMQKEKVRAMWETVRRSLDEK